VSYQPQKRQGEKPLILKTVDADGDLKTNLMLSEEDAAKIQQLSEESSILKECRVIIVLAP
jgi:hypothetical protein